MAGGTSLVYASSAIHHVTAGRDKETFVTEATYTIQSFVTPLVGMEIARVVGVVSVILTYWTD